MLKQVEIPFSMQKSQGKLVSEISTIFSFYKTSEKPAFVSHADYSDDDKKFLATILLHIHNNSTKCRLPN